MKVCAAPMWGRQYPQSGAQAMVQLNPVWIQQATVHDAAVVYVESWSPEVLHAATDTERSFVTSYDLDSCIVWASK